MRRLPRKLVGCLFLLAGLGATLADETAVPEKFRVVASYTGKDDLAHVSFDREANRWFAEAARRNNFSYEATTDWSKLNSDFLAAYQVVLFLGIRPENPAHRAAFRACMEHGGAWLGFHFAAFALTPSAVPQDRYHDVFLGSGQYVSNTWRPASAILRVEAPDHPAVRGLPDTFPSAPNEWYRWERDLRKNPAIRILLSIGSGEFPTRHRAQAL